MQNFREAVKQALKGAAIDEETYTPWDGVLREFTAEINEEERAVFAFVRRGGAPTVRHLVLTPKGRRDQSHILLSLEATPKVATVLSGDRRDFVTVEDFERFLVELAQMSTFRETLGILGAIAEQPVTGFLRFGHFANRSPALDIVVKISPSEQHRLADAAEMQEQAPLKVHVDLAGPSPLGQGTYDEKRPPRWLVAGGYRLEIQQHGLESGHLALCGSAAPQALLVA